jgi:purine-nucleoside phosphorylase
MAARADGVGDAGALAAGVVGRRLAGRRPDVLIVLGSGLGGLAARLERPVRIPFRDIPGFPAVGVAGHAGELVAGDLAGRPVLAQSGRFHSYEGHEPATGALPLRAAAALGARTAILTSAAGAIRRSLAGGTLMLIADHLNLSFRNPLLGAARPGEVRFPDMSDPYDAELRRLAREVARERRIRLEEGVYAGVLGPSYETAAEIRMLDRLGADAVGMSTVGEVIAARAAGLRCLGISAITNLAAGLGPAGLAHGDVVVVAARLGDALGALVEGVVGRL